eukprot:gnl/MRDRNA2_/MRDRNA2_23709_c0_seq1.p1 gnl/MRDRNA2_/MRDRNA2_23709_c0~~gnl/MRDRNA2_/MRDRNA2_23709_c0_seq1.p1  ORF type:complete len:560 (+),score=72.16 gnl/MRDRNA2_/MRDRNA2_23709_c0_seq1:147-1682(+)
MVPVQHRSERGLPVQIIKGHWYFWESFAWVGDIYWHGQWAHYLFQYAAKLQHYFELSFACIGLLVPRHRLTPMTEEFLKVLRVPFKVAEMNMHYVIEDVYVTPHHHFFYRSDGAYELAYKPLISLLRQFLTYLPKPLRSCVTTKKMYLQRDHSGLDVWNRVIQNEGSIISALRDAGFEISKMGNSTLTQKVRMMSCVEELVMQEGTNELNLAFANQAPKNVVIIMFSNVSINGGNRQSFFQAMWGKRFHYKIVPAAPDHTVSVDEVKRSLRNKTHCELNSSQQSIQTQRAAVIFFGLAYLDNATHWDLKGKMRIDYRWSLNNYRRRIFDYLHNEGFVTDVFLCTQSSILDDSLVQDYKPVKYMLLQEGNDTAARSPEQAKFEKLKHAISLCLNHKVSYTRVIITRFDLIFKEEFRSSGMKWDSLNIVSMLEQENFIDDNFYAMPFEMLACFHTIVEQVGDNYLDGGGPGIALHSALAEFEGIIGKDKINFIKNEKTFVHDLSWVLHRAQHE